MHKPPANKEELLRQAKRVMNTSAYQVPGHPDAKAAHDAVTRIFKSVYGSEPLHDLHITGTDQGQDKRL